jgi:copper transport protein
MRRALLTGAIGLLVWLCLPMPRAAAHAQLLSTDPAEGAQLSTSPPQITLTFNEHVDTVPDSLRLFRSDGREIELGPSGRLDGNDHTVTAAVDPLGDGGYVVAWRVVSADSHPIRGAFTFQVGDAAAVAPGMVAQILGSSAETRSAGALLAAGRFASYAGIALVVGVCALAASILPDPGRRVRALGWIGFGVGLAGTLLMIAAQSAAARGAGWTAAFAPDGWRQVLASQAGGWWGWRAVALVAVAGLLTGLRWARTPLWRAGALSLGVALLVTVAAGGHGITGRWIPAGFLATMVHVAAMGLWLGGLAVVITSVTERPANDGLEVVRRFSPIAFTAVGAVVASGLVNVWRQVAAPGELTSTPYGRLLLIKTGLVVAMVGLGALSRTVVRGGHLFRPAPRPAGAAVDTSRRDDVVRLRRNLGAEIGVGLAVLAVTALLVNTRPAIGDDTNSQDRVATGQAVQGDHIALVEIDPALAGRPVSLHVYLQSPGGTLAAADEITVRASLPEREIGPLDIPMYAAGPDHATTPEAIFPLAGNWIVTVTARYGDFEAVAFEIPVDIK